MVLISEDKALAGLLHGSTCPVGYKCQAADCVECLEEHMEKEEPMATENKTPTPKEKPAVPVRCACGQQAVIVKSNGKNMAACPNILVCGLRSGWFGKEQDAIKGWNTLQEEKKSRSGKRGKGRRTRKKTEVAGCAGD